MLLLLGNNHRETEIRQSVDFKLEELQDNKNKSFAIGGSRKIHGGLEQQPAGHHLHLEDRSWVGEDIADRARTEGEEAVREAKEKAERHYEALQAAVKAYRDHLDQVADT